MTVYAGFQRTSRKILVRKFYFKYRTHWDIVTSNFDRNQFGGTQPAGTTGQQPTPDQKETIRAWIGSVQWANESDSVGRRPYWEKNHCW